MSLINENDLTVIINYINRVEKKEIFKQIDKNAESYYQECKSDNNLVYIEEKTIDCFKQMVTSDRDEDNLELVNILLKISFKYHLSKEHSSFNRMDSNTKGKMPDYIYAM
ncbi:hypothetical protein SAMN04487928_11944 [Butyrivibrio proteoclasticus]|uniref:Uncharacterized protein n=1 Tax=Butyrivibrio proteoclasticus TaxID=43305 RepID=A0A1I5VVS0_9FIRM|nr:hypothetical protein [Butyrivibrio proteoclasticus]SFQ11575.1 hypothetical protein SAMN04487928_11944 [Butyrivibrio proteoclasticus]